MLCTQELTHYKAMNLTSSDYQKQSRNVHKMATILCHMIFKTPSESDAHEEQDGYLTKLIGTSIAKVWLFFY